MANKNIYVALRPRPLDPSPSSIENSELRFETTKNTVWIQDSCFSFDHIFDSLDSNDFVYNVLVPESLKVLLEGFNFTILAYGQTGSGKSYTMGTNYVQNEEMNKNNAGIIPHVLEDLFDAVKKKEEVETTVKVSFMELYNDDIIDLLTEKSHQEKCQLRDVFGTFKIKNLTERKIYSSTEAMLALKEGSKRRKTASTEMNLASSRSHAIFFIFIEQKNRITSEMKYSKLQLIDLAGSERSAVSCTSGDRLKEGNHINKGLFELSNVIQALYLRKKHVPYRNSKLTQLLRDSFGGNSCTIMIACISLAPSSLSESVNTIRYASIARKVVNAPVVNTSKELREIQKLKKQVQELEAALLQAKATCSCKNQASFSHLLSNSPDFSATEAELITPSDCSASESEIIIPPDCCATESENIIPANFNTTNSELKTPLVISQIMSDELTEFCQQKTSIFEDDMNVSVEEDNRLKECDEICEKKIKKYLQEIQNFDSIQPCSSFQKIKESSDHKISKLTQEIEDLKEKLGREMKSNYKDFQKVICKTDKELNQLKANTQKTEVELSKAKTGFNSFVKYMKKNMRQALYARKKLTEIQKENKKEAFSTESKNSEYLKDWILKEIEQAVCEKIAHHKMEAAQQEIFNISNEIHKHKNEIEVHRLKKQLEFEQEKVASLQGLPETESRVEVLLNVLNKKEDMKVVLSSVFNMLIAKEVKLVLNTEASQEVFCKQQEKENIMMKQTLKKKLEDFEIEKRSFQTLIAELQHTIKLQNDEIKALKRALDVEQEESSKDRNSRMSSDSSMMGEFLAELEEEKDSNSSVDSSNTDDSTQKTSKFNQSLLKARKRRVNMKTQAFVSLSSDDIYEVPTKLVALCSCSTKAPNDATADCGCICQNEN